MLERGGGRVINIASIAGLVPLRLQSPFVAAKAGVVNLTRSMALELGPRGVLVNAITPGSTLTEGTRGLFYGEDGSFAAQMRNMLAHIPLGRPGEVEEIAGGRPVPRRPGMLLRQRPHPVRRWRMDRRLHDVACTQARRRRQNGAPHEGRERDDVQPTLLHARRPGRAARRRRDARRRADARRRRRPSTT